jgi:hypothetical protein
LIFSVGCESSTRKIGGDTRSEMGRQYQDTFISLVNRIRFDNKRLPPGNTLFSPVVTHFRMFAIPCQSSHALVDYCHR